MFLDIQVPQNIANPLSTSIRELATKLQSTGIISQSVDGQLNIHTDTTAIINAEEALESPVKSDSDSSDYQKKLELYNKIGQREFEDTILFKHQRRKKKNKAQQQISASVTSLSSSGSDEKDSTYTAQSTLMNLSTVGVLPDLRSPESIKNDIEYKERILANVLNFEKANVNVEGVKEEETMDQAVEENVISKEENREKELFEEAKYVKEDEFSIKPFKHILPEFEKIHLAETSGKLYSLSIYIYIVL